MGGCCCCESRRTELVRVPAYYYYPPESEINEPLSTSHITSVTLPGVLVDTNLDTSSPDTYRAPPAPLPYDIGVPLSQNVTSHTVNSTSKTELLLSPAGETYMPSVDLKDKDCKGEVDCINGSPKVQEQEDDDSKSKGAKTLPNDEEDVCPTCLEEYDLENPRIITKCEHHFHMSCILEWMERSNTCPICDQIMEIVHACQE